MSHKIIEHIQAYATDPKDESIEGIVKGFTVLADPLRTECLEKMKAWVADEDGSSLQARAQLWGLTRKMDRVHRDLRKVGR
jgi:hypothetical protein